MMMNDGWGVFASRVGVGFLFFFFARNDEMTMMMAMRRFEMNERLD